MKIFNYQIHSFILVIILSVPFCLYGNSSIELFKKQYFQTNTDTLQLIKNSKTADAFGKKFYSKWLKSDLKADLDSANTHFIKSFNYLPNNTLKHNYALEIARLYHQNKEESSWVKEWYIKSIHTIIVRSPQNVEELLKKYTIMEEFVKLYARTYGKCDDALEILQDYKGDLYFDYIQINSTEKKYTELMEHLKIEEHFLIFDCNIK